MTDELDGRHQRNGHTLHLDGCTWRCLQCRHWFDAAIDAEAFWCGEDCAGKHHGEPGYSVSRSA
jgi:hypothetical protein